MIAALGYLLYHSTRNRLITRFRRLKKPKYLFGAMVGGAYFYFYFFRYLFHGYGNGGRAGSGLVASPENMPWFESLAALVLLVIVLAAWIVPNERAALTFTEAEVAFLFPAPVTRRTLIHFKLVRSQLRIFFSTFILTLFSRRFGGDPWIHAVGWWLVLSTLNLHFLGASFTRTLLLDRGISNWLRRLLVFILIMVAAAGVWYWAEETLPAFNLSSATDFESLRNYTRQVLNGGPAHYLLCPFRLLVRPFFAPDGAAFAAALAPALLLFSLHYLWVIFSDVAFEEASVEASQKLAMRMTAARAGNLRGSGTKPKARRAWFKLPASGPALTALWWKNLIGVAQVFSPRLWIVIAVVIVALVAGFGNAARMQNLSVVAAVVLAIGLGYSLLLGPQFLRLDFRRDLPMADILKTFPLRGWEIALGEILAPVTVLAGFQWLLLLLGSGLVFFLPDKTTPLVAAIAFSAALLLPVLDFLLLLIPNAAVLLFPSWIQTGKDSPRGVEASGQRLIFAVGQLLVLLLALVPVAIAFAAIYIPLKLLVGPVVPVPFASLGAAVVLAAEAGLGVRLLGKLFERFDVTEEPAS